MDNKYLIKALRGYRIVTEGQFGESTSHVVDETQDAADEIERLNARVQELERGVMVSFDCKNTTSGMYVGMSWGAVRSMISDHRGHLDKGGNIVTIIAKHSGLEIVYEVGAGSQSK